MSSKQIAQIGLLCAISAVLGYIESLLPPFVPVQGFKIGLANIAVMFTLYRFDFKYAFFVMLVKVLITSLWFSLPSALIYSLAGGLLSLFAMLFAKKLRLSEIGVGMTGGVFHNIGQLLAAALVLKSTATLYLVPLLLPLGLLAGFAVGMVTKLTLKYTK